MADTRHHEMEGFSLGTPALVCRWRLAAGTLLLGNRHIRALARRIVNGRPITPELVAWAKQHIEWTLAEGSVENPDGVLLLIVDENGAAAMTVGPYEPLARTDEAALIARALGSMREQDETDVAPETLFAFIGGELLAGTASDAVRGGAASLVLQLAQTLGVPTTFQPDLAGLLSDGTLEADEVFLASDEHGVVPASDRAGAQSERFSDSYQRLFEKAGKQRR